MKELFLFLFRIPPTLSYTCSFVKFMPYRRPLVPGWETVRVTDNIWQNCSSSVTQALLLASLPSSIFLSKEWVRSSMRLSGPSSNSLLSGVPHLSKCESIQAVGIVWDAIGISPSPILGPSLSSVKLQNMMGEEPRPSELWSFLSYQKRGSIHIDGFVL